MVQQTIACPDCSGSGQTFESLCDICHGQKRESIKTDYELEIPAGVDTDMVIKLTGEGNHGVGTKAHGDLYIKFIVEDRFKNLRRENTDLYYRLEIELVEAVLGTQRNETLPILGKREIEIPAGTQDGDKLKISGD